MDTREMTQRMREFNGPVMDAALNNPLIYTIIREYGMGRIVTREEALSQMVVLLCKDWGKIREGHIKMMMEYSRPRTVVGEMRM